MTAPREKMEVTVEADSHADELLYNSQCKGMPVFLLGNEWWSSAGGGPIPRRRKNGTRLYRLCRRATP